MCQALYCQESYVNGSCWSFGPAVDGTICGAGKVFFFMNIYFI